MVEWIHSDRLVPYEEALGHLRFDDNREWLARARARLLG